MTMMTSKTRTARRPHVPAKTTTTKFFSRQHGIILTTRVQLYGDLRRRRVCRMYIKFMVYDNAVSATRKSTQTIIITQYAAVNKGKNDDSWIDRNGEIVLVRIQTFLGRKKNTYSTAPVSRSKRHKGDRKCVARVVQRSRSRKYGEFVYAESHDVVRNGGGGMENSKSLPPAAAPSWGPVGGFIVAHRDRGPRNF